jgi:wyosine [tRNA(Phe)-imidazoG37] synthetase (radical SAM superfamily)
VGPTTELTVERSLFVDPDAVVRDVEAALKGSRPEVITLSGSGEPTLYAALDELVSGLRRVTDLPLALLTNGALLGQDDVLEAARRFDIVAPSLDAGDADTFERINRPAPNLSFAGLVDGLRRFCERFDGTCRLEVMLLLGENDSPESLDALARVAGSLRITTVDLNTVVRPPAHAARGLPAAAMQRALAHFGHCHASVIAAFRPREVAPDAAMSGPEQETARQRLLATVARRPCTIDDLIAALALPREELLALCAAALAAGELVERRSEGAIYYVAADAPR